MTEYRDRYVCKKDNIVYWKNHSKAGRPADLFKRNPIHPAMRIVYKIIEKITNPYVLTFLAMSLTFALVAFWIGVALASSNFYHI